MNRAAADLLAPGATVTPGRHVQSVIRTADIVDLVNKVPDDQAISRQIEVTVGRQRRTLDVHATHVPPGSPSGISILLVVRDITDIARTASMKAQFVANASHELRTPLATIRAAVDSLASCDPSDQQAIAKFAGILDRHVRRLEDMTNDLLDLHLVEGAKEGLRIEQIELGYLAGWCESHFASQATERGIELSTEVMDPSWALQTDLRLVQLILQNLVDNGLKFTPAGGSVRVSLDGRDDHAELRVTDTGCGIEPEIQPRVFERFFQADAARSGSTVARGTGLGLAIVKYAVERLGASVSLESQPGEGTTMTVRLPREPRT
jgi:two-component system phosphate regulon sensor histidine kinase PhoR